MQDPSLSLYSQIKAQQAQPQFSEQEHLKCPRCDSANTKFCYYNNYNLSQPRHFCKSCRRYWTKGGTLRNIPVGGASRKNAKRTPKRPSASAAVAAAPESDDLSKTGGGGVMAETAPNFGESFSSLLAGPGEPGGGFRGLLDGLGAGGSGFQVNGHFGDPGLGQRDDQQQVMGSDSGNGDHEFLNVDDGGVGGDGCWGRGGGWPGLSMNTQGSTFHQ